MMHANHRRGRGDGTYSRRLLFALLSALVPGAGQIAAGARRRGLIMLAVVAVLLICGVVLALQGVDLVLSYVVRPRVLLALLGFNVLLLAFRLFAVIDAYRIGGAGGPGAGGSDAHHAGSVGTHWAIGAGAHRAGEADSGDPTSAPLPEEMVPASPPRGTLGTAPRREAPAASPPRVGIAVAALTLLLVLTAGPHGIAGYYTYLSHDLLTSVFVRESDTEPSSVPGEPLTTAPVPSSTSTAPTAVTTATGAATTTTSATDAAPALESGEDRRLTILLIGTDAGYGRKGARADSIMVGTVDLQTGFVALFGIPRNTGDLPLRGQAAKALGTKTYAGMISDLYQNAWDHPELAPEGGNPGAEVLRQTVSTLLGIPVDYYTVIDMGGFVDLVDAFGGITLNVKDRIHVRLSPPRKGEPWREYDIQPGKRHLNGHEALAFARSRTGTNDYDRMRRQRCVLKALMYQNGAAELALKFSSVVKVIRDHVGTDIPVERLPDLVKVRRRLKTDRMLTVGFTPPDYLAGRNELGYNILDRALVQSTVREIIERPEQALERLGPDTNVDTSECWNVK